MSVGRSLARARRTRGESQILESHKQQSALTRVEIVRLHEAHPLLIALQFATDHDAGFDVSGALAIIRARVKESIERLDEATVAS